VRLERYTSHNLAALMMGGGCLALNYSDLRQPPSRPRRTHTMRRFEKLHQHKAGPTERSEGWQC